MSTKTSRMLLSFLAGAFFIGSLISCGVKDSTISEAAAAKISAMPELSTVHATVLDGVVTLSGEVKDDASKTLAENSVKEIKGVKSVVNNCTIAAPLPPPPAPVVISADDPLSKGVTDAIKDFPSVKADVKDGVVTLTGEINKSSLPTLMKSLHTLKPKKIENKLTIK